jgi:acyl-CoA oxidase
LELATGWILQNERRYVPFPTVLTLAHCQFILVKNFLAAIENDLNLNEQHAIKHVLEQLFRLFALHTISQEGAEFLASGYVSARQYEIVKEEVMTLLREVRPNAVALVDAFKFPDYLLNSSLGRYDGNVYKDMTERAAREPINRLTMNVNIDSPEIVRGEEPNQLLKEAIAKSTGKAKL